MFDQHFALAFSKRLARISWNESIMFLALVEHMVFDQHENNPLGPHILSAVAS